MQFWSVEDIPMMWTGRQREARAGGENEVEEGEDSGGEEEEEEREIERRSKRKKRKRKWRKFVEEEDARDKKRDNFFADL